MRGYQGLSFGLVWVPKNLTGWVRIQGFQQMRGYGFVLLRLLCGLGSDMGWLDQGTLWYAGTQEFGMCGLASSVGCQDLGISANAVVWRDTICWGEDALETHLFEWVEISTITDERLDFDGSPGVVRGTGSRKLFPIKSNHFFSWNGKVNNPLDTQQGTC